MYCTIEDVKALLPVNITIGNQNIGTPVPGRPDSSQKSHFTNEQVAQFISISQQYIDAKLIQLYVCPLRRIKSFEAKLPSSVTAGSNVTIEVYDAQYFNLGDYIRIQDSDKMETCKVKSVDTDLNTLTLTIVKNNYDPESKISILKFPNPIPVTTARLACAMMVEKYFNAEQVPDKTQYSVTQRNIANLSLDSIMNGEVTLTGQNYMGRRFVRGQLFDSYKIFTEVHKGEEKE